MVFEEVPNENEFRVTHTAVEWGQTGTITQVRNLIPSQATYTQLTQNAKSEFGWVPTDV